MCGISVALFSLSPPLSSPRFLKRASPTPRLASIPKPRSLGGVYRRTRVLCSSSGGGGRTPGPRPDENESKAILDAFFLGKAFAEALNERIGSAVGEILSVVGQWQAEQQKQIQDFQEEVLERAQRAKVKAALEVKDEEGVLSKSLTGPSDDGAAAVTPILQGPTDADSVQEMLKD